MVQSYILETENTIKPNVVKCAWWGNVLFADVEKRYLMNLMQHAQTCVNQMRCVSANAYPFKCIKVSVTYG